MLLMLCCYFNSIKVQLELRFLSDNSTSIRYFNSIKVQLELLKVLSCCSCLVNFNSIKVQLEPQVRSSSTGNTLIFQFHKGTIRTR